MSVETTMYNNQLNSSFQPSHFRSRSYNELVTKFKQSITSEQNRFRVKKRSYSDLLKDSHELNAYHNGEKEDCNDNKRSRTAPPQTSPSPDVLSSISHERKMKRARSLSPNKYSTNASSRITSPALSPRVQNNNPPQTQSEPAKTSPAPKKSNITLPSISTVLNGDLKRLKSITPTTSLDYFDTYKPNDENWRYGLLDSMNKNKNGYNKLAEKEKEHATRPVFDSKISKPVLPPIKVETERKINFPYESNYTYLNKTYLTDVEKYPEYLELAQSLVQLSNSAIPNQPRAYTSSSPRNHGASKFNKLPPLYPYQLEEQRAEEKEQLYQQQLQEQRAAEERAQQQYYQTYQQPQQQPYYYQPYPTFITSPTASVYPYQANYQKPEQPVTPPKKHTKFIPITPPSTKQKARTDAVRSPPKHNNPPRVCLSCGSDQSPCWRPSWSSKDGQLCNSCGLRYKKTAARCLNNECKKIPAKGEWSLMQTKGTIVFDDGSEGYSCLECSHRVEVNK